MALWGKTDATLSRPKWINLSTYPAGTNLVFVDITEAGLKANKDKGLVSPGWWLYRRGQDSLGNVKHYAEHLVAIHDTAASGDAADDAIAPDTQIAVTITVQPTNQTTVTGSATFGVTATITAGGTLAYQWQRAAAGSNRFSNLAGATSATLVRTAQTSGNTGDRYRVIVSGSGASPVTSDAATLTFGT